MSAGLKTAHVDAGDAEAIARDLGHQLDMGAAPSLVLFFVSSKLDFAAVAAAVAEGFPGSLTVGCTSAGEVGPSGLTTGQVSAIAFAAPLEARAVLIEDVGERKFERSAAAIDELVGLYGEGADLLQRRPGEFVFVSLTDGLSGAEELLLAAIASAAPEVALVGGSAADDFAFQATQVAVGARAITGGAALVLLEPKRAFAPFHLHHYEVSGAPVVVTEADPARRLVTRIDGFPAVPQLAKIAKLDEQALRADPTTTLAQRSISFGFELGPETFIRAVMSVQGEALLMGGSLEEGTLIYPMIGGDIVAATREGLARALAKLREPRGLLLFNCGGRMWEANTRDLTKELARAMLPITGAGFTTYGEQFGAAQVNLTLTGLVFGDE